MNHCTALVPLVDEAAEFRHFERQTDARRAAEERQRREVDARQGNLCFTGFWSCW